MLNVATSRAMPANAVRTVVSMPRNSSLMSSLDSVLTAAPVVASTPSGSTAPTRSANSSCETSPSPRTEIDVTSSGALAMWVMASSRAKAVNVTPPSPSSSPNVAMPTIVASTGSGVSTVVVSPTARSPVSAAPRFTTTSSSPSGARPSARRYGLRSGSVVQLPPSCGGPLPPMASPSAPSSWA